MSGRGSRIGLRFLVVLGTVAACEDPAPTERGFPQLGAGGAPLQVQVTHGPIDMPPVRLELMATLQADSGAAFFDRVIDAEIIGDTIFLVSSGHQQEIRAWRAEDGAFLGTVLRVGDAGRIDRIGAAAEGEPLVAFDRRRSEFWIRERPGPVAVAAGFSLHGVRLAGDTLWVETGERGGGPEDLRRARRSDAFLLDGTRVAGVSLPPEEWAAPVFVREMPSGMVSSPHPATRWTFVPPGTFLGGDSESYAFEFQRGDTLRRVRVDQPNVPLTPEERAVWEASAARVGRFADFEFAVPPEKAAYHDLRLDDAGRVWVRRAVPATATRDLSTVFPRSFPPVVEVPTWDVFGPAGDYMGTIATSPLVRLFDLGDGRILASERITQLGGAERVGVYRWSPPMAGAEEGPADAGR